MAPAHLHCVRHAQGYHNLTPDNHKLPDPALTDLGKQQCADLQRAFPYHDRITHVVASPIKRTLWTALLAFGPAIAAKNLKVIALPEIQETSDLPCDTGSDRAELEREFAGQPVDLSRVEDGWNSKKGRWAATPEAVAERARVARVFLRELAGEDGEVVVVTHGGLLHTFTQDWSGFGKYCGMTESRPQLKDVANVYLNLLQEPAGPILSTAPTLLSPILAMRRVSLRPPSPAPSAAHRPSRRRRTES